MHNKLKTMTILGIETSCDETSICLIKKSENTINTLEILGEEILSQTIHKKYGGVFPALAKREHQKNLIPLLKKVLEESNFSIANYQFLLSNGKLNRIKIILEREPVLLKNFIDFIPKIEKPPIDAIAVTNGPGLEPALWAGINFAKALSTFWNLPLYPINHMEGHIHVALLQNIKNQKTKNKNKYKIIKPKVPALALLLSGGHTELVLIRNNQNYSIVGKTLDDALGEAFDKVARILGLPYPGGPEIEKLAKSARSMRNIRYRMTNIKLPRPMISSGDLNFSFSGLKTAVLYLVKKTGRLKVSDKANIAREFEEAATDVLVNKTKKAVEKFAAKTLLLGGGVMANTYIVNRLKELAFKENISFFVPQKKYSGDNALMIAETALFHIRNKKPPGLFGAEGNLQLGPIIS